MLGWGREDAWLQWLGLSSVWIYKFTVAGARRRDAQRYFRHEPAVSNFIEKKRGDMFIDVGASLGYYSFPLHDNFKEIIAFEPHSDNVAVINGVKQTTSEYGNIKVFETAVSDVNGHTKLFSGRHSGGHSLLDSSSLVKDGSFRIVPTITLETFLGDKIVDLIKVDVEGAEWLVLKGAELVMQNINSWIIEVHNITRLNEMEKLLKSYGYKTKWLDKIHIYAWRESL